MKRSVSLPQHKMPELMTTHFEVNTKVIHNSDVISEVLRCGKMGKPATLMTLWEVNPSTLWGRCSHRSRGAPEGGERAAEDWGGGRLNMRRVRTGPPCLCREINEGGTYSTY